MDEADRHVSGVPGGARWIAEAVGASARSCVI
jgi:hypothetical protein